MASESKRSNLLKNSYVQTAILGIIILGGVLAFWGGLRIAYRTEYPVLAVASPSMVPTLNVGDLIVVQGGLDPSEIFVNYTNGDIIVFHNYLPGGAILSPSLPSDDLIVHRAVKGSQNSSGFWFFTTKGDNNFYEDSWKVPQNYVVGKVVGQIPYLGKIPLFLRTRTGMLLFAMLIIVVFLWEFIPPILKRAQAKEPSNTTSSIIYKLKNAEQHLKSLRLRLFTHRK